MKYIGNHDFVKDHWIDEILNKEGQARPRDWSAINLTESAEYKRARESGYDLTAVHWWVYEKQDVSFDIIPPFVSRDYHWWITKLLPGQYMPMHTDPHTHDQPCKRYWCPLQDYQPGHIFVINDEMVTKYKRGDIWEYNTEHDLHGAANIGHMPRIVLQVTEYV